MKIDSNSQSQNMNIADADDNAYQLLQAANAQIDYITIVDGKMVAQTDSGAVPIFGAIPELDPAKLELLGKNTKDTENNLNNLKKLLADDAGTLFIECLKALNEAKQKSNENRMKEIQLQYDKQLEGINKERAAAVSSCCAKILGAGINLGTQACSAVASIKSLKAEAKSGSLTADYNKLESEFAAGKLEESTLGAKLEEARTQRGIDANAEDAANKELIKTLDDNKITPQDSLDVQEEKLTRIRGAYGEAIEAGNNLDQSKERATLAEANYEAHDWKTKKLVIKNKLAKAKMEMDLALSKTKKREYLTDIAQNFAKSGESVGDIASALLEAQSENLKAEGKQKEAEATRISSLSDQSKELSQNLQQSVDKFIEGFSAISKSNTDAERAIYV